MRGRLSAALLGAALFVTGNALAENSGSVLADSADSAMVEKFREEAEAKTQCPPVADKWAAYTEGSAKKWDRAAMGCALSYGSDAAFELSIPSSAIWAFLTFRAGNIEKNLTVLGSNIEYFDVLAKSYAEFYQGIELESELSLRWEQTRKRCEAILARLSPLEEQVPEVRVLRAAYLLASTRKETPVKQQTKSAQAAIKDLEIVVKDSPKTLDGLPQFLLGETLDRLPEILGGNSERAVSLLEEAHRRNPVQLDFDIALATAYIGGPTPDKALPIVQSVLTLDPERQNPQDYIDDLKYVVGLAQRIKRPDLALALETQENAFSAKHPYVLQRIDAAAFGHSDENPITGAAPETPR